MEVQGVCYAIFAYDIGLSINLDLAEERLLEERRRKHLQGRRRAPEDAQLRPAPLRVIQIGAALEIGNVRTDTSVELVLYDFGAVCISYPVPVAGKLETLVGVSDTLYDNKILQADSRARIEQLLRVLGDAVEKPAIAEYIEDYAIFDLRPDGTPISDLWTAHGATVARLLRAQPGQLSEQESADALSQRTSYTPHDVAIIDWFGALLCGEDMSEERLVLEFAVVELLELRCLDAELDKGIDSAYALLTRPSGWFASLRTPREKDLHRISQLQADSALLFEGVNNSLKLLGDQYLARLYRVISERLHLSEWDEAIQRKLGTVEGIYGKLSDRSNARRVEMLEWIIIVLIALSIAGLPGH